MKYILMCLVMIGLAGFATAADEKKESPKGGVGALPPHDLDKSFEGDSERAFARALQDNNLFKKALAEALKAKEEQANKFKQNPKLKDKTPEQAARQKFLEVLLNEKKDAEDKK
jgi:hypothetical protein